MNNFLLLINWGIGHSVLKTVMNHVDPRQITVISGSDITSSDKFKRDISFFCKKKGIKLINQEKADLEKYFKINDIVISAAYPNIINENNLKIPRYGVINLHGSMLPKSRGVSPVNWSLIRGEDSVGLTTHCMEKIVDSGDILYQTKIPISISDSVHSLSDKISKEAVNHVNFILKNIKNLSKFKRHQNLKQSTLAPRLTDNDYHVCIHDYKNAKALIMGIKGRFYKDNLPYFFAKNCKFYINHVELLKQDLKVGQGLIVDRIKKVVIFEYIDALIAVTINSDEKDTFKIGDIIDG
jgi:methionyl-tRNA formyltransferase